MLSCVPLAMAAAIQATAVAPLASELQRLRDEPAKSRASRRFAHGLQPRDGLLRKS